MLTQVFGFLALHLHEHPAKNRLKQVCWVLPDHCFVVWIRLCHVRNLTDLGSLVDGQSPCGNCLALERDKGQFWQHSPRFVENVHIYV